LIQKQQLDLMIKMASGECLTRPISEMKDKNEMASKSELEKRIILSSTATQHRQPCPPH